MSEQQPKDFEQRKAFVEAYGKLCAEHGYQFDVVPQWKQSLDTGTWNLVITWIISEYKEPPK